MGWVVVGFAAAVSVGSDMDEMQVGTLFERFRDAFESRDTCVTGRVVDRNETLPLLYGYRDDGGIETKARRLELSVGRIDIAVGNDTQWVGWVKSAGRE